MKYSGFHGPLPNLTEAQRGLFGLSLFPSLFLFRRLVSLVTGMLIMPILRSSPCYTKLFIPVAAFVINLTPSSSSLRRRSDSHSAISFACKFLLEGGREDCIAAVAIAALY